MKTKYLLLLSEIIDKMDIKEDLQNLDFNTGDEKADREKLGTALITLLMTKIYKCPKEVYTFIASFKNYYPENIKEYYRQIHDDMQFMYQNNCSNDIDCIMDIFLSYADIFSR